MQNNPADSGLTADQVRTWFPEDDLQIVPVSALPEGMTDSSLRSLLTEVGLPQQFTDAIEINDDLAEHISTMAEVYAEDGAPAPDGSAALYFIGFAGEPFLSVDGQTGAVYQVHDDFGTRPLSDSMESFLRSLGYMTELLHPDKPASDRESFIDGFKRHVFEQVESANPQSWPQNKDAWAGVIEDVLANITG